MSEGNPNEDDPVRTRLRELCADTGTKLTPLSRHIGLNRSYLSQYLGRRHPRTLPETVREALGRYFRVHPDTFKPPTPRANAQPNAEPLSPAGGLDTALLARAEEVARRLGTSLGPIGEEDAKWLRLELTSAAYTLLERASVGLPVTDDDATLRVVELLIQRWRERHP